MKKHSVIGGTTRSKLIPVGFSIGGNIMFFVKLIICVVFLHGCAGARTYEQSCVDIASSAGHTYERMFGSDVLVAVGKAGGKLHAQAYCVEGGEIQWLTATFYHDHWDRVKPILAVGVDPELDSICSRLSLDDFDNRYVRKSAVNFYNMKLDCFTDGHKR